MTLRVLDSLGKQIGVLPKDEALKRARAQGVDLVEVAPRANPPVARIINYNKFLYQQEKKKREEKKKAKISETKEIRLGPFMDDHDLSVRVRRGREFLEDNDKVRLVLKFIGRQIIHPEFGQEVMGRVIKELSDFSKVEREPHFEGKQLISIITPEKKKGSGKSNESGKLKVEEKDEKENQKISSEKIQSN
jgi:translation initiation factor IF-3